jgi:hypothetical protein
VESLKSTSTAEVVQRDIGYADTLDLGVRAGLESGWGPEVVLPRLQSAIDVAATLEVGDVMEARRENSPPSKDHWAFTVVGERETTA